MWIFSVDYKSAELGFELLSNFMSLEYMHEASEVILDFAFNKLQLDHILAFTHKQNSRSIKALLNLGFKSTIENVLKVEEYDCAFILEANNKITKK